MTSRPRARSSIKFAAALRIRPGSILLVVGMIKRAILVLLCYVHTFLHWSLAADVKLLEVRHEV